MVKTAMIANHAKMMSTEKRRIVRATDGRLLCS